MKKYCSITVDLDSFKVLLRFYGFSETEDKDFYQIVIPRFIDIFDKFNIKATFFIIGSDIDRTNVEFLKKLVEKGHEIANHTYSHPFGMSKLSWQEKQKEIQKNEELIKSITGTRPVGFRAPGYDIDPETLNILEDRGYLYDSSVFPTLVSPLFKIIHKLLRKEGTISSRMGSLFMSFAPIEPYFPDKNFIWKKTDTGNLLEIPISVTPFLRLPFYASFHLSVNPKFFNISYKFMKNKIINYLFHGIELVDAIEDGVDVNLLKHPNVSKSLEEKVKFYQNILNSFFQNHVIITTKELAEKIISQEV